MTSAHGDAFEEIQDLQIANGAILATIPESSLQRRNELLRPVLREGFRLRVFATVSVGAGHRRGGLCFEPGGTDLVVGRDVPLGSKALEDILEDPYLRVFAKEGA